MFQDRARYEEEGVGGDARQAGQRGQGPGGSPDEREGEALRK